MLHTLLHFFDRVLYVLCAISLVSSPLVIIAGIAFRQLRVECGFLLTICSRIWCVELWIQGLYTTFLLWGTFATIVGVLLCGVGVVPMAFCAALFKGDRASLVSLSVDLAVAVTLGVIGFALLNSAQRESDTNQRQFGRVDLRNEEAD